MNILQVVPRLDVGGVETGTVDLASRLKRRGHKAVVISAGGRLVKELESLGIKHYTLGVDKKSFISFMRMIPKVTDIIRKEEIDIVHARSRVPGWICFFAARKAKRAFITTCHGRYSKHFFSRIMGQGRLVIVPSQVMGRYMVDNFNVASERIRLIERSVNMERFKFHPAKDKGKTEFIIANIARLTPQKGHTYFLKAIAKLIRTIPYVQVWIIGDSPENDPSYRQELGVLCRRLGISHCVKFMGLRTDVPKLLTKVDVLVLSTITAESFGRVIIEAQAAGTPVVATEVGGVVEIIEDGITGLLVPPQDTDKMAAAIVKLLKQHKLNRQIVKDAYKKVKEVYTLKRMVDKELEVYEEALSLERILIVKFSALGDILLITPSLKAIRNKFKKAKIYCLTSVAGSNILKNCPYLDDFLIYDYKQSDKTFNVLRQTAAKLRSISFDKVIDLQNNNRSHLLSFLSLARERFGYDNRKLSILLNKKVKDDKHVVLPPVEHQAKTLNLLGVNIRSQHLEIWPSQADEDYVDNLLNSNWMGGVGPIAGIHIGASRSWPTKLWPVRSVANLIDQLAKENVRILLLGSTFDLKRAEDILDLSKAGAVNLCGKTSLLQLAALIKRCNCLLCHDSLALHMASAVGTPFAVLFGPTDPARHMPPAKRYIAIHKDMDCRPCYKRECKQNRCMIEINAKEVAAAVKNLLG